MRHGFSGCASRGRLVVTLAAGVLLVAGTVIVGVGVASQRAIPGSPDSSGTSPRTRSASTLLAPEQISDRAAPVRLTPSKPIVLDIPSIRVHSAVQTVGRTAAGALETPAPGPRYDDAAWYRHSPTPGSLGPAILLGHVDSASNGPSVFFRLGELRPGDEISVGRADGSLATFVVDKVRRYSKNDFPTQLVYGDIDHAGLRILTCGGAFDGTSGHYLDNVVVFASLVTS